MTTTPHPTLEVVAAMRAREPDTVLIFKVGDDRYAAFGPDAPTAYLLVGGHPGTVLSIDIGGSWVEFAAACFEPLMSAIAVSGKRAAVCERTWSTAGPPVERVVTAMEGGGA